MEKEITPKKTILAFTILLSIGSYFALDYHYKTRAKDIVFTIVNSSGELIKVNNFMQFGSTIKFVISKEPFIKTVMLFDKDFRKLLNFGHETDISTEFHQFNSEDIQILQRGLLDYTVKFVFNNDSDLTMIAILNDDNAIVTLLAMISFICLLFGFIYLVYQRFDFDNLNAQAAAYALDLMSCGFHEMKQTVELFRILQEQIKSKEVSFKDSSYANMFISDFDKNMISVDSMMSIMKLTSKNNQSRSEVGIDLKDVIQACINTYKNNSKNIDIKFDHQAKLHISKDVIYATIGNLIKNAYTYSDGLIWIRTYEEDKKLIFTIANTGKPIPKEKQKIILKPGIALKGQTGLGLHICDTWCRKIGAKLSLESNYAATLFSVAFAIPPRPQKILNSDISLSVDGPELIERSTEDKSVAVIDDIKTFRVSICTQVEQLGYQAEHYENMDVFLDILKHDPMKYNYILIDRHGDGFDAVKDRFPDSCRYYGYSGKIILYSSDIPNFDAETLRQKGFDSAVKKGNQIEWENYLQ